MSDLIDRQALLKQIDIDSDGEPGYYGDTWKFIDTIKSMPPATQLSTNLAEVGTDCISREQAIVTAVNAAINWHKLANPQYSIAYCIGEAMRQLPPIQPDIVRCKDCKYAEYIDDVQTLWCTECGNGRTVAPYDFCSYAEKREVTT